MTPELRSALYSVTHRYDLTPGLLDAIEPIIAAAIADARYETDERAEYHNKRANAALIALESARQDALLSAADDLDTIAASAVERNGHIIAWAASFVRGRANEGSAP